MSINVEPKQNVNVYIFHLLLFNTRLETFDGKPSNRCTTKCNFHVIIVPKNNDLYKILYVNP